jgi:RNA polymerase sigma factor for flagellar operon FliA
MGLALEEYQALLFEARGTQLIYYEDYEDEEGNSTGFLDRQMDGEEDSDPLASLNDERFRKALIASIEVLPEREKLVMGLYYEQELNFREIAAVLTVTESRVCQLHSQAIARLRVKMKEW